MRNHNGIHGMPGVRLRRLNAWGAFKLSNKWRLGQAFCYYTFMQKWASKGDGAFHAADRCLGKRGVLKVRNRQPLLEHSRGKVKHNPVFNVALLWGLRFTDRADDSITALIQNSGFCEWTMITQQSDRGTSGSSTKQHFFCWKQLPTTINPLRRLWLSKVSKRCVLAEVWALEFLLLYY